MSGPYRRRVRITLSQQQAEALIYALSVAFAADTKTFEAMTGGARNEAILRRAWDTVQAAYVRTVRANAVKRAAWEMGLVGRMVSGPKETP